MLSVQLYVVYRQSYIYIFPGSQALSGLVAYDNVYLCHYVTFYTLPVHKVPVLEKKYSEKVAGDFVTI